jgi:hypothetical protein
VAEEWCPLIWAGRAKQESYGSYVGVEVMTHVGTLYEEHPGLTRPEAEDCGRRLAEREAAREAGQELVSEELKTPGGKPCRVEAGEREKRLVGLWTPFFQEQYRNGLDNIILFLAACRSGINERLLKHLAQDGNDHVAVFGFDDTVAGTDAFDVGNELLRLLDEGYHSTEMIRRLKLMDRTKHLVGRALDLGDEALPATPAEVIDRSAAPTHGRDVVALVHAATGNELQDGGTVNVLGSFGDADPDALDLRARLIGVAETDDIRRARLRVTVAGERSTGQEYEPRSRVEEGVWEHARPVALGRDAREDEVVDLEIEGDLPGGGTTRWVYREVVLRAARCEITVTVSGAYSGTWRWTNRDNWGYTNSLARNGYFRIGHAWGHFQVVHDDAVRPGQLSGRVLALTLIPPGPDGWSVGLSARGAEGTASFRLTRYTGDQVSGVFRGKVLAVPPTPDGRWYGPIPEVDVEVTFDVPTEAYRCRPPTVDPPPLVPPPPDR